MRIRTIKPEFFTHDRLFESESESGLPLRIAFAGLWCAADREGRFKWEPRRLGVQILPYDNIDFSRVLDALTTRGFVIKYTSGNADFGWIPGFNRHQVVNNKERASELPEPILVADSNACSTRASRDDDACRKEGKGKEHGKEHGRSAADAESPSLFDSSKPKSKAKASTPEEVEEFALSAGCATGQGTATFWKWEGNGWMNGKAPIKDWKATIIAWLAHGYLEKAPPVPTGTEYQRSQQLTWEEHMRATWDGDQEELEDTISRKKALDAKFSSEKDEQ